jgi:thiol-disulfide isomerase/thioredoxin
MNKITKFSLLYLFSLVLLLSCKESDGTVIGTPIIKAGKAKITGRITSPDNTNKNNVFVNVSVSNPISGEQLKFKTLADQSGKFSIDIDVETDVSLGGLYISLNPEKVLLIKMTSGGVTNIDIAYNSELDIENIDITPDMNQKDMTEYTKVLRQMLESGRAPSPLYDKSVDEFLNYTKTNISKKLEILNDDRLISKELKEVLSKDFRLMVYSGQVFDYEGAMGRNYRAITKDKINKPDIKNIDESYFRFLKGFNLNDPQYLLCYKFPEFQKKILQNEVLSLPEIGDTDIISWLSSVKVILSDLVGFKDGPYYDILAANAYGRQLTEEVRSLTEKQKDNIANYWKKGEIAKILFRKNQQVVELDKFKSPPAINDVSKIPADKTIENIVSKHKGKVILIDLWATWCSPCLEAMQRFTSTKTEFHNKDVVFVYLTNRSSPRKLWKEKIKGIGNEHYYLDDAQWNYIMDHFEFKGIPSYLLYDKKGVLINKFTAFPENEYVKAMIDSLLK